MTCGKNVNIRKARPEDAENILSLLKIIGGETDNLTFGAAGIPFSVQQEAEYLEGLADSKTDLYLVAEADGELCGTACYSQMKRRHMSHRGEISIALRKSVWGCHVSTRLMERILDFAENECRAEIVSLKVRSDNARAIALYKKFGFETVGTFPGFMKIDGKLADCDIMCLRPGISD